MYSVKLEMRLDRTGRSLVFVIVPCFHIGGGAGDSMPSGDTFRAIDVSIAVLVATLLAGPIQLVFFRVIVAGLFG